MEPRGKTTGITIQPIGGKYAELAARGQLFNFSVKTAAALTLAATTGGHPTIWNPPNSGKILQIYRLCLNWLSGTNVVGSVNWRITANTGDAVGTGLPIATWIGQDPDPALYGAPFASKMRFSPATNTFTAAPAQLASSGINLPAASGLNTMYIADYDGTLSIYPGNAISLCYSVTTSTGTWFTSIYGAEYDL
jgi:hypothetical protein